MGQMDFSRHSGASGVKGLVRLWDKWTLVATAAQAE